MTDCLSRIADGKEICIILHNSSHASRKFPAFVQDSTLTVPMTHMNAQRTDFPSSGGNRLYIIQFQRGQQYAWTSRTVSLKLPRENIHEALGTPSTVPQSRRQGSFGIGKEEAVVHKCLHVRRL